MEVFALGSLRYFVRGLFGCCGDVLEIEDRCRLVIEQKVIVACE